VALRLAYLMLDRVLSRLALLACSEATKDVDVGQLQRRMQPSLRIQFGVRLHQVA
jgi:hypothetical protein